MKKLIIFLLTITSVCFSVYAVSSDLPLEKLSKTDKATLFDQGELTRYFFSDGKPEYFLQTEFQKDLEKEFKNLSPNIGVESIFLYKTDRDISLTELYNILLSIRTMKGIEYYSASRKKMRTLFTESYFIESPDNPVSIPDPVVPAPENEFTLYADQTDKTFGRNIYRTEYRSGEDVIWVKMVNETSMKYKFIKMVDPGNISINLFVKKVDDGILFYGITGVKTFSFFGLEKTKKESFYNRIKAMYGWFVSQTETIR